MSCKGISPALSLFAAAMLFPACAGGSDPSGTAACTRPEAVAEPRLNKIPDDLPLDRWGTVIEVSERAGYVGAEAISQTQIVELYPVLSRHLMDNGYVTVSGENEGFEAEIFFQKGRAPGSLLLREGPCKGDVTVKLLFNVERAEAAGKKGGKG
jgi:hypothetical protein